MPDEAVPVLLHFTTYAIADLVFNNDVELFGSDNEGNKVVG
jgi:hypothetical protein